MAVVTEYIRLSTKGNAEVVDITTQVQKHLSLCGLNAGIVTVSVVGSTCALTTCEYEPGLVKDIKDIFDKLIPAGPYHHDQAWGDGNGHSHLRSSLVGPSVTFPFRDAEMILGTWQQIIFIDFDNRSRQRELVVQILGE
ncbi:MAG: secondary thiamine-phosphate synthase enzyme YjbQ [Candidatus Omnitrophica bacterium]|nr:secondary thiamine-phosphate synthase enzyme YjbQ [Candidatus Omnitrophota bacterium]